MKGRHRVVVKNRSLHYDFEIRRNITILQGASATGKTTLMSMIRQAANLGRDSGVEVTCDVAVLPLEGPAWKLLLRNTENTIFFSDEDSAFIHTEEFASELLHSDNYAVLITRENLYNLPYSAEEIYGIHSSGKYQNTRRTYQTLYRIYPAENASSAHNPDIVITEDSGAGFEFFRNVCEERNKLCLTAGGKSNLFFRLKELEKEKKRITAAADGAAIGPEMDRLAKLVRENPEMSLYLPESFEWLILESGVVHGSRIREILNRPEDFIESREYGSWEQFFTKLLMKETENTRLQYQKKALNPAYLHEGNKRAVLKAAGWADKQNNV